MLTNHTDIGGDDMRKFYSFRFSFVKGWGGGRLGFPNRPKIQDTECWIHVSLDRGNILFSELQQRIPMPAIKDPGD